MSSTTSLHFGPEWMRAKPAHVPRPAALDPSLGGQGSPALSYSSSLHSLPGSKADAALKYSKEELLQVWKDAAIHPELSGEVERWDGVVSDDPHNPLGLIEMDEAEKKVHGLRVGSLTASSLTFLSSVASSFRRL